MSGNAKTPKARAALAAGFLALAWLAQPAAAEEFVNTGYFGDVAIKGYDTVAYFTRGEAMEGSQEFSHRWLGATWHFASPAHRDLFAADPAKYAPQYGGYCAWAASRNYVASTDPEAWDIVDDKLYLNFSKLVHARWSLGKRSNIAKGDANWPGLLAGN